MTHSTTLIDTLVDAASCPRGIRVIEHDGSTEAFSYAELLDAALRVASALAGLGLAPGDRVALVIPGVSDFIRTFFGISAAGLEDNARAAIEIRSQNIDQTFGRIALPFFHQPDFGAKTFRVPHELGRRSRV